MNPEWRSRYELAIDAAHEAGRHALSYFEAKLTVEWKQDQTPVTVADRETEKLLRRRLLEKFPDDGLFGEEFGDAPGTSGYRWVIDPIDGTRSFVRGIPIWATLVALEYKGEPIAGIAEAPAMHETHRALRGDSAFRNDRPIHVSDIANLNEAQFFYSSLSWFMQAGRQNAFSELVEKTNRQRGFGDYYGFVLVAQGAGEFMAEYGIHRWDVAALKVIVEEAGGRYSNWQGRPDKYEPDVLVSNGKLHDEVLRILDFGTDQ
jgi:histidinol-phosphatase